MVQPLSRLKESPSQTAGPYIHIGATPKLSGIDGIYTVDPGKSLVFGDPVPVGVAELDMIETFLGDVLSDVRAASGGVKDRQSARAMVLARRRALALAAVASKIRRCDRNQDRNTAT